MKWGKTWGKLDLKQLRIWHDLKGGVFPVGCTLSAKVLALCKSMMELKKCKLNKKDIDWDVFKKWKTEAERGVQRSEEGQNKN